MNKRYDVQSCSLNLSYFANDDGEMPVSYTMCLKKLHPLRQVGINSDIFQIQASEICIL